MVVGRADSYLMESGFHASSTEGYRFWLGEIVGGRLFESPLDFERVRSILVPDKCFMQASLFSFPSQVWWIQHLSSCGLGPNFNPFSQSNTGLRSTHHHLVQLPSYLLWAWRSHLEGLSHLTNHFSFSPFLFIT